MKIIGLTGGVGCGKSTVAQILTNKYNADVIYTDDLAKTFYTKGSEGYKRTVEAFSEGILNPEGEIDTHKLAKVVFANEENVKTINGIIHPLVMKAVLDRIEYNLKVNVKLMVIESAILVEAGYKRLCDEVWYVHSDRNVQSNRLVKTRGYSQERIDNVTSRQANEEAYKENCDRVIVNNSTLDQLEDNIDIAISEIGGITFGE